MLLTVLSAFDRVLTRIEKVLLCLSLALMLGIASLQVILRNAFGSGLEWGDVAVRHLVLYVLFFGASLSTKDKRHIQMDLSAKIVPPKVKPYLDFIINSFCIVVSYFLYKAAYVFWFDEKGVAEILFLTIPTWTVITIIPVGFALMTFRFAINWTENITAIFGKPWCSSPGTPTSHGCEPKQEGLLP